jgi:hypothetical protein
VLPGFVRQRSVILVVVGTVGTASAVIRYGVPDTWAQGAIFIGYGLMVVFGVGDLVLRRGADPSTDDGRPAGSSRPRPPA